MSSSMLRATQGAAFDKFGALKSEDHLVNRRWRHSEEALQVGFGGRTPHHSGIGVDEGQILALWG
jgi:hypothetical protein